MQPTMWRHPPVVSRQGGKEGSDLPTGVVEGVLIGFKNYMTRSRSMRNNEQFHTNGCGIFIDGDERLYITEVITVDLWILMGCNAMRPRCIS